MSFRDVLKEIQIAKSIKEETTSGDIATVDNKLGSKPERHQGKSGKKCLKHKRVDCLDCQKD